LHEMRQQWPGEEYDIFRRNCGTFANALCHRLGVGGIPVWVNQLAEEGGKSLTVRTLAVLMARTGLLGECPESMRQAGWSWVADTTGEANAARGAPCAREAARVDRSPEQHQRARHPVTNPAQRSKRCGNFYDDQRAHAALILPQASVDQHSQSSASAAERRGAHSSPTVHGTPTLAPMPGPSPAKSPVSRSLVASGPSPPLPTVPPLPARNDPSCVVPHRRRRTSPPPPPPPPLQRHGGNAQARRRSRGWSGGSTGPKGPDFGAHGATSSQLRAAAGGA